MKSVHEGIRRFKCDFCQKQFTHRHYFKLHQISCAQNYEFSENYSGCELVQGDEGFKCYSCKNDFPNLIELKTHISTSHNLKPKYQCNVCLKNFIQNGALKEHLETTQTAPREHN